MQFKFQPILNLKKHHEDKCRTRLSEEQTKLLRIKQELATLAKAKKNQQKEAETLLKSVSDIDSWSKAEKDLLMMGVIQTAECYISSKQVDKAKAVLSKVAQWYEGNEDFKTKYDEIVN